MISKEYELEQSLHLLSVSRLTRLPIRTWSSIEISVGGKSVFFDLQTKRQKYQFFPRFAVTQSGPFIHDQRKQ